MEDHPRMLARLEELLSTSPDWEGLLEAARESRMEPLLYRHLRHANASLPASVAITLKSAQITTRNTNLVRYRVLHSILEACYSKGYNVLVLKGAALQKLVYPELSLRPMADIDLWVRPSQAERAYYVLGELGFELAPSILEGVPAENHHFAPAKIIRDDVPITVEIHRRLFRPGGEGSVRGLTFEAAWKNAQPFELDGLQACTLGPEDMLWHVYRHCCCGSLRYLDGDFRLIRIADFVGAVEKWADILDWEKIRRQYPELVRILPAIHFLTPWSDKILALLRLDVSHRPGDVGQLYVGYPSVYARVHSQRGFWTSLKDTLAPPTWWFCLHYGVPDRGWRSWIGRLEHVVRVTGDLVVYLLRLGLGLEKPDRVSGARGGA